MFVGDKLKGIVAKLREVGESTGNAVIILVMSFISDILLIVYNTGGEGSTGVKIARVAAFAIREFEVELRKVVNDSPTPYDDKLVDELFEVVEVILPE